MHFRFFQSAHRLCASHEVARYPFVQRLRRSLPFCRRCRNQLKPLSRRTCPVHLTVFVVHVPLRLFAVSLRNLRRAHCSESSAKSPHGVRHAQPITFDQPLALCRHPCLPLLSWVHFINLFFSMIHYFSSMSIHPTFCSTRSDIASFPSLSCVIKMLLAHSNLLAMSLALRQAHNARTLGASRLLYKNYTQLYTIPLPVLSVKSAEDSHVK